MGSELHIRPATPGDLPVLVEFQLAMAAETEGLVLDRPTVEAGVEAVLDDPGKGSYHLAELGGRVVGCLLVTREWSDWRNGAVLWIQSVYVTPDARGRGVFRALYDSLKREVLASPGLKGLRLYVDRRNAAAKQVYEALGMSREHYELYEWLA